MADGSFNMLDSDGNNVEISTFEMDNCTFDENDELCFGTTDNVTVKLPEQVEFTDNTFGFNLPPEEDGFRNRLADVELIGHILEQIDDPNRLAAFVIYVNNQGWRAIEWAKVEKKFEKAYAGSYESYAEFAQDEIDDHLDAAYHQFVDADAWGRWSSEHYTVEEGEDGMLHFFNN